MRSITAHDIACGPVRSRVSGAAAYAAAAAAAAAAEAAGTAAAAAAAAAVAVADAAVLVQLFHVLLDQGAEFKGPAPEFQLAAEQLSGI